jgi:hypothetical protein
LGNAIREDGIDHVVMQPVKFHGKPKRINEFASHDVDGRAILK